MSFTGSSIGSGGRTVRGAFEFGRTYVVRPKGGHQATVVWLHGLGDDGSSWSQLLETLPLPNIKWICPTAPTRPISVFGGFPSTAWFDVGDLSEDAPDDLEGLDAAAAHVANLLSNEPADIKLGIGGFSMGAATALYSATCFAAGKYGNGNPYPANLSAAIGLSGWLPCAKILRSKLEEGAEEATRRATSLPILLCHGKGDASWLCDILNNGRTKIGERGGLFHHLHQMCKALRYKIPNSSPNLDIFVNFIVLVEDIEAKLPKNTLVCKWPPPILPSKPIERIALC